jgi:hypothetical protein
LSAAEQAALLQNKTFNFDGSLIDDNLTGVPLTLTLGAADLTDPNIPTLTFTLTTLREDGTRGTGAVDIGKLDLTVGVIQLDGALQPAIQQVEITNPITGASVFITVGDVIPFVTGFTTATDGTVTITLIGPTGVTMIFVFPPNVTGATGTTGL